MNKQVIIIGGGTFSHIRSHLALATPAFGQTARRIADISERRFEQMNVRLILTKMAENTSSIITNEDVNSFIQNQVIKNPLSKVVFMNAALCDFAADVIDEELGGTSSGKYEPRLDSSKIYHLGLAGKSKIVSQIRENRKDIFLVSFKTTSGDSEQQMYLKGLNLLKNTSSNLVLVNDLVTRLNMIITPEEAAYHQTTNREEVLNNLVDMTFYRSHLTFTQSTVVSGNPIPWNSEEVPESLRQVVNYCVSKNAYKPFKNSTVGHFAVKLDDTTFLTSIRKSNFNELDKVGLVKVKTDGSDTVIAYGAKPSVGGQSQRMVFRDHLGFDCIAHFHCPLRANHPDDIPIKSQREVQCGSHQCGQNTSNGLKQFGNLKAVYLEQHGPNIIFNKNINPEEAINFIERNFDLSEKTGGYNFK